MRLVIAFLMLAATSSVFAAAPKKAEKMCPKYRCVVSVQASHTHSKVSGYGYGDTVAEATSAAFGSCQRNNTYGGCKWVHCAPDHGPVFPIFSSCKDAWKH